MPTRHYFAPVIGTGTATDPYRATVADLAVSHVAVIPSRPDGTPRFPWALVTVAAPSFSVLDSDPALAGLPAVNLDLTLADLPKTARDRLLTLCQERGIDTTGVTGTTALRQVVRRIGRHLEPDYDERVVLVREDGTA